MLINCTPHDVFVIDANCCEQDPRTKSYKLKVGAPLTGQKIVASGLPLPRCSQEEVYIGDTDGVAVFETRYGDVVNLPEEKDGVYYIVSALCAQAARHRRDLLIPTRIVRDSGGNIIGCLALARCNNG